MKVLVRRIFWVVSMSIFLFMTTGCGGKTVKRSVELESSRKGTGINEAKGQRVSGYVDMEGEFHDYEGYVALVGQDTLSFWKMKGTGFGEELEQIEHVETETFMLPADEVLQLKVKEGGGAAGTIGTVLLVVVGLVVVVAVVALATSCPFIYSWDGQQYVFDGEPFGGATMASLQRTDYSELEHLVPVNGEYRLRLANEVDETQHTDEFQLVAVDHPRGARPVMDYAGRPHCFGSTAALSTAHDENGNDLVPWLHADDDVAWNPDLAAYAAMESLPDTRNHITLEFPRPAGRDSLYLVSNHATGQWGSQMIRVMLGMRGDRVQEFYAAINGNPEFQDQLRAWNEREELFILGVEVQEGADWVRRGELHGGGPYTSERRAMPLDLSGVEGETVRLRIHPPIGFWSLNSFHLAWDEQPATVSCPAFVSARDQTGRDVMALLAEADDMTLDFPTIGERADLVFAAVPGDENLVRTVFARTTGWYEVHLYPDGPPEADGLRRLTFEPGYIVQRAMEELEIFRTTGVLRYGRPDPGTP